MHDDGHPLMDLTRRHFLALSSALATAPLSALGAEEERKDKLPRGYRRLGRTGLHVSPVSFGGHAVLSPRVLDAAIEQGVNLIHTAPVYRRTVGMRVYAEAMKTKRDRVVLMVKGFPRAQYVDRCLKLLKTDRIDVIAPPAHDVETVVRSEIAEEFNARKKEGKVRFLGVASHRNVADVAREAVRLGHFDVLLLAYNMANRELLEGVVAEAAGKDVAVIGMKSLRGVTEPDQQMTTFKALMSDPGIVSILKGMESFEDVERFVSVWREDSRLGDRREATSIEKRVRAGTCAMCGACQRVCPRGVAVSEVFRYEMYLTEYHGFQRELGVSGYGRLPAARTWTGCDACGRCEQACPNRLPIVERLAQAHQVLSLAASSSGHYRV